MLACDVPDFLHLTFADGTAEQIEVERGGADEIPIPTPAPLSSASSRTV